MKKMGVLLFAAMMGLSGFAMAKDWKTIRFGTEPGYAPFESKAPDGKLIGFDIDIGNELCKRANAKCVWVENDFDGMIPALKAKKFDGILSSMSMTDPHDCQDRVATSAHAGVAERQARRRAAGHHAGELRQGTVVGQGR